MIGYKAFNDDLTCRDFQYEVGKIYSMNDMPKCCFKGFHFCKDLEDCFRYYNFGSRICEIETLGDLDSEDNKKFCTNRIKIIRELSFEEICSIIGIEVNLANNLIKSFKLTKEFFRGKNAYLCGGIWFSNLISYPLYWELISVSEYYRYHIEARLNENSMKIEFFDYDNSNKVLFECDNKKIYQVNKIIEEDLELFEYSRDILEWFEYLKENLEF